MCAHARGMGALARGTVVLLVVALNGCSAGATDDSREPVELPTAVPAAAGLVTTVQAVTVLEGGGHGPELCLGMVADSLPPQCGGLPLDGWVWAEHEGEFEESAGVRWGEFAVTGHFDGATVTVTDVVSAAEAPPYPVADTIGTPCPEPEGGWRVLDPSLTTEASMSTTFGIAAQLRDYSQAWMDQSLNPASAADRPRVRGSERPLNDPRKLVINVAVTGDLARAESRLREVWGGALCVSQGLVTERRRTEIQEQMVAADFGFLGGMGGGGIRPLEMDVVHDDGSIQAWLDQEFGAGTVVVDSALQPAD